MTHRRRGIPAGTRGRVVLGVLCLLFTLLFATTASAAPTLSTSFDCSASPDGFCSNTQVAVDEATGDVYVIDAGNGVIDRFDKDGTYLSQIRGSDTTAGSFTFGGEDDIAVDNTGTATQGDVYVVSENAGTIFAFDPFGRELWERGSIAGDSCGVAVDTSGNPWIGDYNALAATQLRAVDGAATGTTVDTSAQGDHPCELAFDLNDNLYVNNWHRNVDKFDASGAFVSTLHGGPDSDVATDSANGNVFVAYGALEVHFFDSAGVEDPGSPFAGTSGPKAITVDGAHRRIYVSGNALEIWDPGTGTARPFVRTQDPTGTTLNGTVNPAGDSTTCAFEYVDDTQFQIDGFASATSVPCDSDPGSGTSSVPVTATAGLTGGTTYHVRLVATNSTGTTDGSAVTFVAVTLHTLTVNVGGTGSGRVDADHGAISGCTSSGGTCSGPYPEGDTVTLTATPGAHSSLSWTGCDSVAGHDCRVTVNADTSVTATFTKIQHRLTVTRGGSSSGTVTSSPSGINCGNACSALFDEGTQVTLTATPGAHSTFAGWSGGGCSGTGACRVTLNGDTTVSATFAQDAPSATTGGSSSVTETGATVSGIVNPNGADVTNCHVEYGTSTSYGSQAPCVAAPGSGTSPVAVSASLSGLTAGTTYHYRVVATNAGGTANGDDATFTTAAGGGGGGGGGGGIQPGTLALASHKATVTGSLAGIAVSCTGDQGARCSGSVTFTAKVKKKVRRGRRTVVKHVTITVGSASYDLAAGSSGTLSVKLTRAAKQALKQANLIASADGLDGTVKIPKAKKHRRHKRK